MEIFSKILFTGLFFSLIQYLQRTCDGYFQCDAIFLKSTFYSPVLFPNSVHAEDVRRPYLVWCNFSQKCFLQTCFFLIQYLQRTCDDHTQYDAITLEKVLQTCCFSYFSFYRVHVNAILSVMQFFPKVLFTDLFFFLIQCKQRTCDGHTQCDANFLKNAFADLFFFVIQYPQRKCYGHNHCDAITL